jgi:hypothetical protein|tara:strand:- start:931 stop:1347 length:417 start_codon:yes stop_codon:yes gene_type:complete
MDKKDKLSANLQKNLPIKKPSQVYIDKKDIKDDYEYSRKTYKDLIDTGVRSLDVLAELARESEHPRAFEVLSKTIKDIGDTTEKLMDLQKSKKEINKVEAEEKKQITNNNLFVGSTTELQRILQKENERIIDHAEDKE